MANALSAVLGLIAQEKQQEQFRSQQITQAAELFQRARQAAQQNQLEKLRLAQQQQQFDVSSGQDAQRIDIAKEGNILRRDERDLKMEDIGLKRQSNQIDLRKQDIDLAKSGFKYSDDGIVRDESLMSPEDKMRSQFLQQFLNNNQKPNDVSGELIAASSSQSGVPEGYEINPNFLLNKQANPFIQKKGLNYADSKPEDVLQAASMATAEFGKRNADKYIPIILKRMSEGIKIDDIQDELRMMKQSEKFTGALRDASQLVVSRLDGNKQQYTLDVLDDYVQRGDVEGFKEALKVKALDSVGVDDARVTRGRERTVRFLAEIKNDLAELEKNGVDTNIFSGTIENISRKIGLVKDPELRKIANKIRISAMDFRRDMSGAAFSMPEDKDYQKVFPNINNIAELNSASIGALEDALHNNLDNFYSMTMGEKNYKELYKKDQPQQFTVNGKRYNIPADKVEAFKKAKGIK